MDPWNPLLMAIDEVSAIPEELLKAVGDAHGSPRNECPDCESHWDRELEDRCASCGLSADDLRDRIERRAT